MAITPEIEAAVAEIQEQYSNAAVVAVADGDGGAYVTVSSVALGAQYSQSQTWIKFHITVNYPIADVYPHYIEPAVRIKDAAHQEATPLGEGSALGSTFQFAGEQLAAIQLSRKSNRLNSEVDTAALKLAKVVLWLEGRT